jgi:hypothetical protein
MARALGNELGQPIHLWRGFFQLHAMDDADLQRRTEPARDAQDIEYD